MMKKILAVGDIHGKHEYISTAFDKFLSEKYDYIVFLGDYVDSYTRSDEDMLRCLKILVDMKALLKDKAIYLLGNHDIQYFYDEGDFRCSGYRPNLFYQINSFWQAHKKIFDYAWGIGNYFFAHAGMQRKWYLKYFDVINRWADVLGVDITDVTQMWKIINALALTKHMPILNEVGVPRGGYSGDYGGLTWCDKDEMLSFGPLPGLHQIVGHTRQPFIRKYVKFEGDKQYNNTSVTFIDVLDRTEQFHTIEVNIDE